MRKIVSFASTPNEAIKWSELGKYKRLSKEELYIYDFENIEEVHFIGSKKGENDYEIEETKWGIYINMEEAILLYICSWQTKEFQLLEKINKNIKCLDIRFTSINELDISEFDKINKLVLSNNRYLGLVNGIEKISGLRELYLNNSSIEKNPDLNNFPEIYVLNLSNTLISDLEGDEVRRNCKFLDLSNTKIKSCKTIQIFPNLRRLSLQETDIVSLKGIEQLKKLESLNCRDTRIETINEVMNLEALTSLNISYTNIKTLDKVMFPNTIRSLVMDGIGIKTIPVNICMLKNLRKLGISNMHLDSLPPEILDLQLNFNIDEEARKRNGINLFNTKIDNMDESVLQQPRTIISAWFKNNNRVRIPKKLNEAKVVFLGDGGAGKTFSIQRLLNNCEMQEEFSGESTPGISIQDCKYEINGEEILIHYWDFGGQEIMHSMHRMFLTKRTLYVVFVNARDNTQDERARYWLHNIKSFADNSPVIMVINQMDQNPSASVNESSLRRLYPELRDIIKMSAITFTKEAFEDALQKQIIRNIKSMQIIDTMFSDSWIQLKKCLQEMQEFYIDNKRFMDICDICEVEADHTIRMQLLDWFSDLGISFCYSDSHQLANYMVLRPDWITNAIYIILFNGVKYASGKRIHELELLKRTLQYRHGIIGRLQKHLSEKYHCEMDEHCTENVINMMTNEFPTSAAKKTYAQCVFLKKEQDDYGISDSYEKMLQNPEFCAILEELVDFGISRYKVNYSYHYQDTNLVLYQKYTYEDACRLLNWERNEVPLNIGGYKYDKKTKTFPIFINYDKQDDISDTTKYEDHFVAENRLIAISKSGRSMDSEDVQNFLNATERGIDVQLFVRKNKDDKISKEFYYLGRVIATGNAKQFVMPNTDKTAVEIEWELETPVREDIYQYIVNE